MTNHESFGDVHTPYIYKNVWNNSIGLTKQSKKQNNSIFSKRKGITLIALVVTIVVLLILAGITINTVIGENGIIQKAQQAKDAQIVATYKDRIEIVCLDWALDKSLNDDIGIDNLWEKMESAGIILDALTDVEKIDENGNYVITVPEGYKFQIHVEENGNVTVDYIGKDDVLLPYIQSINAINTTSNSMNIEVTVMREGENLSLSYYYKKAEEPDSSYRTIKENVTEKTAEITGLESETIYNLKVVAKNENGESQKIVDLTTEGIIGATEGLVEGAIISSEPTWNNGLASITLSKGTGVAENLRIEYQIGDITEGNWTMADTGSNSVTVSGLRYNNTVYARLTDGINHGQEASITIKDGNNPAEAIINLNLTSTIFLGESTTATVTQSDNESGVNATSSKWEINTSSTPLGINENSYSNYFTSSSEEITIAPVGIGDNYLHVLTVDNAGNKIETVSEAINVPEIDRGNVGNVDIQFINTSNQVVSNVATPSLGSGMTPIKWNGSNWVQTTSSDPDWYSYTTTEKKWANVVINGTFTSGILNEDATGYAMFVWIPRYAYKIEYLADDGQTVIGYSDSRGIVDTNGNVQEGTQKQGAVSVGDNYVVHPAFSYFEDNRAISGIWVAKFEASHTGCTTDESTGRNSNTNLTLQVKPGVTSWRALLIGNAFTVCQNYNTTLNSHMMKNSEWGAVAYLTQSEYGKNEEVWINNSSSYITGSAGSSASAGQDVGITNDYASNQGQEASTTGNIYGIYDMSGGALEFVSAYLNNGNGNLITYGSTLADAPNYMKDVYEIGSEDTRVENYVANAGKYGDAIYETSSGIGDNSAWYDDTVSFGETEHIFFRRSARMDMERRAGLFYNWLEWSGNAGYNGFRPILITP